ncbi:MAG: citrate transporter [Pseudobutyrivibrio sp.]|nr:citrate transporter [Pseudobutyrivibrio sp.]
MDTIKRFIKNEIVLCVAFILAFLSSFLIIPDRQYFSYIDYRTLSILLCLMITMAGFQKLSVFRQIGELLVSKMGSLRGVSLVLIGLCFFSSMFITNDVALLTFVPFSIITLSICGQANYYIIVIVLETIAANLGSMLTPLGNPQNLYLYSLSNMSLLSFIKLMIPYSVASAILLLIFTFIFIRKAPIELMDKTTYSRNDHDKRLILMYILCFIISIIVVARVLPYYIGLILVVVLCLLFDKQVLKKPDYSLIFTFVFLFIFIGNLKRIPELSSCLENLIRINEVGVSILLSQFISNVPAAILCSAFTTNISKLIIGTNLGGLGTLIASMASLISFKQYCYIDGANPKKYFATFTLFNIIFLVILVFLQYI